jgi:hypothetical protein
VCINGRQHNIENAKIKISPARSALLDKTFVLTGKFVELAETSIVLYIRLPDQVIKVLVPVVHRDLAGAMGSP